MGMLLEMSKEVEKLQVELVLVVVSVMELGRVHDDKNATGPDQCQPEILYRIRPNDILHGARIPEGPDNRDTQA